MKVIVSLLVLATFSSSIKEALMSKQLEDLSKITKLCFGKEHMTIDDLKEIFEKKPETVPQDVKCQIKCAMEHTGQLANGKFDAVGALKFMDDIPELKAMHDNIAEVFEKCKNESGSDECDTAYKIHACLMKQGN